MHGMHVVQQWNGNFSMTATVDGVNCLKELGHNPLSVPLVCSYELNLSAMESKDCIVSVEPHYQVQKGDCNVFKVSYIPCCTC